MSHTRFSRIALILSVTVVAVACAAVSVAVDGDSSGPVYEGSREEVDKLIADYARIELTPEQEAVRLEALQDLPAACCGNFSMATCCCECNLSRTIWGLSKHLIADKGASADEVRTAVLSWIEALNPEGYAGDTCGTGRCNLAFKDSGCGGMRADHVVF